MNNDELKRQMTNSVRRQSENILALTASAGMGEEETEETWTMDMKPKKKKGKASKKKSRTGSVSKPAELSEHISTDTTRACSDSSSSDENKKPPAVSLDEKRDYRKAVSISESDEEVDVADQSAFADEYSKKSASVEQANTSNHARPDSVQRTSVRRSKGGVPVSSGPKSLQPGAVAVGISMGLAAAAAAADVEEDFDDFGDQDGMDEAPPTTVLGAAVSDASSMTASVISAALSPREEGAPPAATLPKSSTRVAPDTGTVVPEMPALKYHESVATATAVVRDDLEEEVRRQIMSEVIVAEVVPLEIDNETRRTSNVASSRSPDDTKPSGHPRFTLLCVGLCCAVFSGAVTGMLIKILQDDTNPKSKDGGKGSPNNNNPPNNSDRDDAALLAYLQIQSPSVTESGSPQSRAFAWMKNNSVTTTGEYGLSLYEIYALGVLYYSTGGDQSWTHTTNWLDFDSGFCSWYPGDLCDVTNVLVGATDLSVDLPPSDGVRFLRGGSGGSVVTASNVTAEGTIKVLDLGENNLQGTIPSEIRLLSNLERLMLDKNPGLVGTLPPDIGTLESLEGFFAGETSLSGTFPTTMEDLDQLKVLNMAGCRSMSGTFPRDLWHLKRIWTLDLEGLGLEGSMPGPGRSPRYANLRGNRLSGTFPDSWWPQLSTLDLRDNHLTGTIPASIYRSWNNSLYELRLEGNNFNGTIPEDVCTSFNQSVTENPSTSYIFSADCKEDDLECECCTLCCRDGEDCEEQSR